MGEATVRQALCLARHCSASARPPSPGGGASYRPEKCRPRNGISRTGNFLTTTAPFRFARLAQGARLAPDFPGTGLALGPAS